MHVVVWLLVAVVLSACIGSVPSGRQPDGGPTEEPSMQTLSYGEGPDQVGDLYLPEGEGPYPVVVLLHGGFWREQYRRDLMAPLAEDLVRRGWAVWNVEYRRVGASGGGYPQTLRDVSDAVDHLASIGAPLDLDRVAFAGHSAGGHLATWLATRSRLPDGVVGSGPTVTPCAVVSQAGVNDLTRAARDAGGRGLGGGATRQLLDGTPEERPENYDVADPARNLPLSAPWLAIHGQDDDIVPVDQSRRFAEDLRAAGGTAELAVLPGDHFAVLNPAGELWARAVAFLREHC